MPDSSIDDVDHEVLDRYKELLGTEAPDEQVLRSRRFMRDGKLTVAGALLFAQDPSVMMPQARVRVLRYDGVRMETGERFNITKERTFCGPLPKVIEGAHALISGMLREFQFLGPDGKFRTVPEYPEFAWFEGLVNAVTHRDYAFRGDYVRVSMFDDRLEIVSPGALPNIVTLDNMCETRYSRNPRIARTLVEFGWVREINEGVQRIYSEMRSMLLGAPTYSGSRQREGQAYAGKQYRGANRQTSRGAGGQAVAGTHGAAGRIRACCRAARVCKRPGYGGGASPSISAAGSVQQPVSSKAFPKMAGCLNGTDLPPLILISFIRWHRYGVVALS